jgi:hypothetical protein
MISAGDGAGIEEDELACGEAIEQRGEEGFTREIGEFGDEVGTVECGLPRALGVEPGEGAKDAVLKLFDDFGEEGDGSARSEGEFDERAGGCEVLEEGLEGGEGNRGVANQAGFGPGLEAVAGDRGDEAGLVIGRTKAMETLEGECIAFPDAACDGLQDAPACERGGW